jgi:glutamate 5-kinase
MGGDSYKAGGVAVGYGGMAAKLQAAKLVTASGTAAVMASGLEPDVIVRLAQGERVGTYFAPTGSHIESRKRWMLSGMGARGEVVVDEGAVTALTSGNRSLLPAGITGVRGGFNRGDVITVLSPSGDGIAMGIANYDSTAIDRIKGVRSSRIAEVLGHEYGEEVIHRSNLVKL